MPSRLDPPLSFSKLELHPQLLSAVEALGFEAPTDIQTKAIPPALAGRDVLACAMTGSGKTAAFLLPILHQLLVKERKPGPRNRRVRVLILSPTRELAGQIHDDLRALAGKTRLTGAAIFGGVGMAPQEQAFRDGVDVLVATPGRLLDHLSRRYASLDGVEHLVLDEADRMLDMGFLPDIKRILARVPERRQTLFFSATMPRPIIELSRKLLQQPERIDTERRSKPAHTISQTVYPVPMTVKPKLLLNLLDSKIKDVLVFTRTKHRADRVARLLVKAGVNAERIHGNRSQGQRQRALDGFKSGLYRVLVATDIAARGIDVSALGHVVNFDVPNVADDYIHRVGRTGRAEAKGEAFTFVSPEEEGDLRDIERAVGKSIRRVVLSDFDYTPPVGAALGGGGGGGRGAGRGAGRGSGGRAAKHGKNAVPKAGGKQGGRRGAASKGAKSGAGRRGVGKGGSARMAGGGSSAGKKAAPRGIGAVGRRTRVRRGAA